MLIFLHLARDLGFQIGKRLRADGEFGVNIDYRVLEFAGDLAAWQEAA